MSTFKVGEIAIGCNYITLPDRNGMECEIIEPLQLVTALECGRGVMTTKLRYGVRWTDGLESVTQPFALRKKPKRGGRRQSAHQAMLECIDSAKRSACEVQP
jgi:hypothetical protein